MTDQLGQSAIYSYDAVGNLLSIARPSTGQVTIQTFAPVSGFVGSSVTILGSGFNPNPGQNTVKFNGVTATVTSVSSTVIVAIVPVTATTGTVSVTNSNGTATSGQTFTVTSALPAPTISSFTPTLATPNSSFSITGTNFVAGGGGNAVSIGPVGLSVAGSTATVIDSVLPSVVGSGKLTVQTAFGSVASSQDFIFVPPPYRTTDVTLATRATLNTNYTTNFTRSGQAAIFIFDGTVGQKARMLANTVGTDNLLSVYNPDGTPLMSDFILGSTGKVIETPTLPATGT